MSSRDYFLGKRVAIIGFGANGEMIPDAAYLIKSGALVSVYDLKREPRVKNWIVYLRTLGLANYVCGSIPQDDLMDMDLIVLSHDYPRDSSFLKSLSTKFGSEDKPAISVEYPETLFFRIAPPVTVIGVMGPAGKSTVVSMLTPMLEAACADRDKPGFFVLDPESPEGILAHLERMKNGDIVLMRLTTDMTRELNGMHVSPHVAVFTGMPPKGSYEDSPFDILDRQTHNNYVIASDRIIDAIHDLKYPIKAKMFRTKTSLVPNSWELNGRGAHDRENAALALQTARIFRVPDDSTRDILRAWKPLKGRLEPVKKVKGVEFYNDSASVSSYATEVAIQVMSESRNVVLIMGGADAGHDYSELYAVLSRFVHTVILLPGSGTLRERRRIESLGDVEIHSAPSLEEAVRSAFEHSTKGDKVLFSPGFAAGGFDVSRKERGERFVKAVRAL